MYLQDFRHAENWYIPFDYKINDAHKFLYLNKQEKVYRYFNNLKCYKVQIKADLFGLSLFFINTKIVSTKAIANNA